MKIRLAKHTRALAAALAFCVLSAVPAYAQEDDTVEVPGVPVTLSLPAGSLILTRETPVDDAIFETLNVDGAAILENMNKNDLYLDAVLFKPPLEFQQPGRLGKLRGCAIVRFCRSHLRTTGQYYGRRL